MLHLRHSEYRIMLVMMWLLLKKSVAENSVLAICHVKSLLIVQNRISCRETVLHV